MDKEQAKRVSKKYLNKVRENNISFEEAWLFGSYARGTAHGESDIDIAIVCENIFNCFDTEVKLITLREGDEIYIEPHTVDKEDFHRGSPLALQIIKEGERLF
jgi:predicted nucleotidyltransferase